MSYLRDLIAPPTRAHDLWREGWTPVGGGSLDRDLQGDSHRSASGETVKHEKALSLVAYYAALRNLSQDVAKLPRQLRKKRATRGSDLATEHPAFRLIKRKPNPVMNGFQFVQTMQFRALGWGKAAAEIVRDRLGNPIELWPIHPSRISPHLEKDGKTLVYNWRVNPGDQPIPMPARDILWIASLGNGFEGYSLLRIGAEALGLGLAAQRNAARFFSENLAKRLVVFTKNLLSAPGRRALRQRILEDQQTDPEGRRKLPIIEGDHTIGDMGIPPEDAQLLESREFTTEEIGRLVRMALAKIQYHKRAQGWNSLELQNTDYATDSLMPWNVTWEQELGSKLLTEEDQETHFFKFELNGLMRGDSAARSTYYDSGLRNGWLSPNDVRELEDMNPIDKPEADDYRVQAQMTPIDKPAAAKPMLHLPAPNLPSEEKEPDEDEEEEEEQEKAARDALRPVFVAAATRIVHKEANALQRALRQHASNAKAFSAWAITFYPTLATEAGDAFGPALTAASTLLRRPGRVPGAPAVEEAFGQWVGIYSDGMDWAAHGRVVATAQEPRRVQALSDLMMDLVLKEAPGA